MELEQIIKELENDSTYWKDNPTPFTQGRMFQANKTLEQLRLYAVVGRSEQDYCQCDVPETDPLNPYADDCYNCGDKLQ